MFLNTYKNFPTWRTSLKSNGQESLQNSLPPTCGRIVVQSLFHERAFKATGVDKPERLSRYKEHLELICPREHEIKESMEKTSSVSHLDCYIYIDNGNLLLGFRLYDIRGYFNFPIVTFPFLTGLFN